MTSWKRLFGKKTKKAHRKLETRYEEWLRRLHQDQENYSGNLYAREMLSDKKKKT